MTIRDPISFLEGIWEWTELDSCFTDNIRVTDLDGLVERRGKFLVIEAKRPGCSVPLGQRRTLNALLETGVFTVVVVWGRAGMGRSPRVGQMQVVTAKSFASTGRWGRPTPATNNDFGAFVTRWFEWAESTRQPESIEQWYDDEYRSLPEWQS